MLFSSLANWSAKLKNNRINLYSNKEHECLKFVFSDFGLREPIMVCVFSTAVGRNTIVLTTVVIVNSYIC